jgi:hypothetical protein
MKPAYSITKKRNTDRLLGTVAGAGIGVFILYFFKDRHLIIGVMIVFMIVAYSFMRTRYLVFVTFMTPYILILFYLLNPNHFRSLISDRILDTAIGSAIAWLANVLLAPAWAYKQFSENLRQILHANKNYFRDVSSSFVGKAVGITQYKLSRKQAYVALANISDALNQMLAEPKRKQKNAADLHQLVVLNYMMASHTATLATIARGRNPVPADPGYLPLIEAVNSNLTSGEEILKTFNNGNPEDVKAALANTEIPAWMQTENSKTTTADPVYPVWAEQEDPEDESSTRQGIRQMNERVTEMVSQRKKELTMGILKSETGRRLTLVKSVNDQFNFIYKISEEILKNAERLTLNA